MNLQLLVLSLSLSMVYFAISSGFSLIFGLMKVLNYAHASLVMWGAYVTYAVYMQTGHFLLGVLAASVLVVIMGALMEIFLIRNVKGHETNQLLLTFGLVYILNDATKIFFGTKTIFPTRPGFFNGVIEVGGSVYPVYRLFLIGFGVVLYAALMVLLHKTRLGMIITAGTERPRMVRASGIDIKKIFTLTFCIGSLLAALSGGFACFFLGLYPNLADDQLLNILAVVIIGGIGSISGTFIASIMVGVVQYIMGYYFPIFSMAATIALMILILIVRPDGLLKVGARNE